MTIGSGTPSISQVEAVGIAQLAARSWEDWTSSWGGVDLTSKEFAPVYVQGGNFFILGYDSTLSLDTRLERLALIHANGLPLIGTAIYPQIVGPSGGQISISMGASETPEGSVDWEGPYTFTIGEDTFVDFAVSGKYLAVKFESTGVSGWALQSYDIDYEVIGGH